MRITSSDISLASTQISIKTSSVYEHLRKWNAQSDITSDTYSANGSQTSSSMKQRNMFNANGLVLGPAFLKTIVPLQAQQDELLKKMRDEFVGSVREQIMKDMIEIMTGKKIKLLTASDVIDQKNSDQPLPSESQGQKQAPKLQGWGVDYYYQEIKTSKEGVAFSAKGTVTTADGRAIDFTASLEMTHETYSEISVSVKAGDALIDPLMVDTTGSGAQLSGVKFNFDLNADGVDEQINMPGEGTGFLAYDRNGNGIVDNGSELFGPASGNGFSELSLLDTDKNGWIDENDPAFNQLKVWQKNPDGTDSMTSLRDSDIGAIYTGHAKTKFSLTSDHSSSGTAVTGVIRESGVFLKESGGTGIIQEVDMVA
jgi:hypothetical protein